MPVITHAAYRRVMLSLLALCASASSSSEAVAQEVGAVADKVAIAEQLAQYSYRWDAKDGEEFADLFTEDGVMERWREGELVSGSWVVRPSLTMPMGPITGGSPIDRPGTIFPRSCSWSSRPIPPSRKTWP